MKKHEDMVRLVYDDDGDWQVISKSGASMENAMIVTAGQAIACDASIADAELESGEVAVRRDKNDVWKVMKML